MLLLALDTATATASIAIYHLDRQQLLAEQTWLARRRQTQETLAVAQQLFAHLDLSPQDISGLAVTTGPGSFSGVRIAISAVKGIGLGLPAPARVIGIPTLSVTAAPWLALAASGSVTVCACLQAGRSRFNWAFFEPGAEDRRLEAGDHHAGMVEAFAAALAQRAPAPVWLVGEGTELLVEGLADQHHIHIIDSVSGMRRAGQLARLAADYLARGVHDDLGKLQPLYLQSPG